MRRIIQLPFKISGLIGLILVSATAIAAGRQVLHGHVPEAISRLHPLERLPATNEINLAISLPLRNQSELTNFLEQLYNPASTNYHQYLAPEQFAERFGPTAEDYEALKAFTKSNHLAVTGTFGNRQLLNVSGRVPAIENTFHVTLRRFHHPTEARDFYASDAEPSVDTSVPLQRIYGLNNFDRPQCFARSQPVGRGLSGGADGGSAPGGYLRGKDFRNAYAPGVTLDGSGQMVGLVEFDNYYASDINAYESQAGLPNVPIQNVLINTGPFAPSGVTNSVGEVSLDIEMVISMATNLTKLYVFESSTESSANWATMLNSMASSNQIKQFSSSWGWGNSALTGDDQYFQTMAAQGQTFFQALGDGGAFITPIPWPGDSPYVISVGGTTLTMDGASTSYASETVWNSGFQGTNNVWYGNGASGYWASGGGVSTTYSIPSWQVGVNMTSVGGSNSKRNVPDVALTANQIWVMSLNGVTNIFFGTSCAAPLWAGFAALVNQQCARDGRPSIGFINPALYALGKNGGTSFHDITTGNNAWSTNNFYYAASGYDLCTGWGTPSAAMIGALENFAGAVWVDFSVVGPGAGTYDNPYNTLTLGINNVAVNGTVAIKGVNHTMVTPPLISKAMIINASGGQVTLGQ